MKMFDLHCDTINELCKAGEQAALRKNNLHVDLEKLQRADAMAQVFALYVNIGTQDDPLGHCLFMLDRFYREIARNSDIIAVARNYDELQGNVAEGRISAFLAIEDGGVLRGSLYNLRNFHRLGVRVLTLTHNLPNEIGNPNLKEEYRDKGLTDFGREAVAEMNRLGMIVDVSHLSDAGFFDVAQISTKPFIASHSNARSVRNHPRNLTDDMIRVIAEKGGVLGINFHAVFTGDSPVGRVEDLVAHIKHAKEVGGVETIAIGGDLDGTSYDREIEDVGQIHKLTDALEKNGFSTGEMEKIFHGNVLRVIKEAVK